MKKGFLFRSLALMVLMIVINTGNAWAGGTGVLPGKFSVSANKQVQFTGGNLFWDSSAYHIESAQSANTASDVDITVPNADFYIQDLDGRFSSHIFTFQGYTADSASQVYVYFKTSDFHAGTYSESLLDKDLSYMVDSAWHNYTNIVRTLTDPVITITDGADTKYYNLTYSFVGNDSVHYNLDMTFQVPYEETWHESVASDGVLDKSKLKYNIHMIDFTDSLYHYNLRLDNEVAGRDTLRFNPEETDDTCDFCVYDVADTNGYYLLHRHYSGWLAKTDITDSTYRFVGEIQCNGNKKFYINCKKPNLSSPAVLPGKFSVSATKQVQFTGGNLYWDGSAYHIESSQSAYPTSWDANHVGHFFWANTTDYETSAMEPYAATYAKSAQSASDTFCFGEDNKSNTTVDDQTDLYALASAEWVYLLETRAGNRFAKAKLNDVNGLIIFPDNYSGTTTGDGIATVNDKNIAYPASSIETSTWSTMESAGCVFLPAAGLRSGSSFDGGGSGGFYWSATPYESDKAYAHLLFFYPSYVDQAYYDSRSYAYSVRLVKTYVVAKIGDKNYTTLNDAVDVATSGQTIKLLMDCDETTFTLKDGITLDTDGHKITTTNGWTLAAGSVTNTNALTNAYSGEQYPKTGEVRGEIYSSTGTLDLTGTTLWVYDTAKMSGGTKEAPEALDALKATMLYYGWTQGPAPEATTIKNIVLDQYTAGQRAALSVYDGTLTVDSISVDDSNLDWYKSPESNFQVCTGGYKLNGTGPITEGGNLVVNKSLTTAGFLNASSWIYGAGKTILNEGAVLNAYDFQNRGRLHETARVEGTKATANAVMFTNSAYTELGTLNLTGYDQTTTYTTGDLYIASTGTWDKTKYNGYGGYDEAYTKIGQLNVTEDKKYTFRSSDGSEMHIGGINTAATNGLDYYVTDSATVSLNEDGSKAVQLNGDIVFASYSDGTSENAKFTLKLSTPDSYFAGAVKGTVSQGTKPTSWAGNPVIGDEVASTDNVKGMTITMSNGSVWNMTDNSIVNNLTLSASTINGSSYGLTIPTDGTFSIDSTSVVTVNSLTNNGTVNLKGGSIAADVTIDGSGMVNWVLDKSEYTASKLVWTNLSGTTNIITVDADAAVNDTYTLATSATTAAGASFTLTGGGYDQTIKVGAELGTATAVDYNGFRYKLYRDGTNLVLSIVSESSTKAIVEYAGGQSGQQTSNDNWTYYTKLDAVAAAAFEGEEGALPGAKNGATNYKWIVSDAWVGYEDAKTQYNWDEATTLSGDGVALGESESYKFVYLAGYDADGSQVSMNIYQVLSDKTGPFGLKTIRGDADATTGWVNAASKNKTVTGHGTGGENDPIITESTTTVGTDGYFTITINAYDKPVGEASGVVVTELNGDVQKYEISTDNGANWTEYTQADPWKVTDGTYGYFKMRVTDKVGNSTTASFTNWIKVDMVEPTVGAATFAGTSKYVDSATGKTWFKQGDESAIVNVDISDENSGVDNKNSTYNGIAYADGVFKINTDEEVDYDGAIDAHDAAGNGNNTVNPGAYGVDGTGPTLTVTSNQVSGIITVTAEAIDNLSGLDKITYSIDGGEAQIYTQALSLSVTENCTISFTAYDNIGNISTEQIIICVPQIAVTTEGKWFKKGDVVTISGTYKNYSGKAVKSIKVTGLAEEADATFNTQSTAETGTWSYTYTGPNTKETKLTFTITDGNDLHNIEEATYTLKVDTVAPTALFKFTDSRYTNEEYKEQVIAKAGSLTFDIQLTDATSGGICNVSAELDGAAWAATNYNFNAGTGKLATTEAAFTGLVGKHKFAVKAIDAAGNDMRQEIEITFGVCRNIDTDESYATLDEAIAEVKTGETIELLTDVEMKNSVEMPSGTYLDLKGFTLTDPHGLDLKWDLTDDNNPVVKDFDKLNAQGTLTLNVNDLQTRKNYVIAKDAANATGREFTLPGGDMTYDHQVRKVAVGGEPVFYGHRHYSLKLNSNNEIVLTVTKVTPKNGEFWGVSVDGSTLDLANAQNFNVGLSKAEYVAKDNITSFVFNGPITRVGVAALKDNLQLKEIYFPASVEIIAQDAVRGCENLEYASMLDVQATAIGPNAFENDKQLTLVEWPEQLAEIDAFAFAYCDALEEITLPKTLKSIYGNAFSYSKNLKEVTLQAESMDRLWLESFEKCHEDLTIYVPYMSLIDYEAISAAKGLNFQTRIPVMNNGSDKASVYCHHNMTIPAGVTFQTMKQNGSTQAVAGGIAPGGAGYIVEFDPGVDAVEIVTTAEQATSINENVLRGVLEDTQVSDITNGELYELHDAATTNKVSDYVPAFSAFYVKSGGAILKFDYDEATGVLNVNADADADGATFNTAGQQINEQYKGIVIKNGKKYLNK